MATHPVDVASRESVHALAEYAASLGDVVNVVHTAGLSPVQASPEAIFAVDLYGVAVVLEEFGQVIAAGGSGLVVSSMAGHMIPRIAGRARAGARLHPGRRAAEAAVPVLGSGAGLRGRVRDLEAGESSARARPRPSVGASEARG